MKNILIISLSVSLSCNNPKPEPIRVTNKLAEQTLKDAERNSRQLDTLLMAVKIVGVRDSFIRECHKLEVLYYKTDNDKYRVKHNKLVDSVNKYTQKLKIAFNK